MATKEPKPVKQLKQLLQEQQEPFILQLYLGEKGYPRTRFNPRNSFTCCNGNSTKSLNKSVSFGLQRSEKGIPHCSKVFRIVYNQVISLNQRLRIKSKNHRDDINVDATKNKVRNNQEAAELDRFSSASNSTVFNSCYNSGTEDTSTSKQKVNISYRANTSQAFRLWNLIEKETVTDGKLQWKYAEESRQLSPVSVLEEVEVASDRGYPLLGNNNAGLSTIKERNPSRSCGLLPKKVTEGSILSTSLLKIIVHSGTEKPTLPEVQEIQELIQSNLSSQFPKSKNVLQQTKQLLFDCVKEIVETKGREEKQQQNQYLASEELGKLLGKKIIFWGKEFGDESNLTELLQLEFQGLAQEWSCYKSQRSIGFEIGDAILEEINSEIVMDMIDFLSPTNGF